MAGYDVPGSSVPRYDVPGFSVPGYDVPGSGVPGSSVSGYNVVVRTTLVGLFAVLTLIVVACGHSGQADRGPQVTRWAELVARSGGMTTAFDDTERAFGLTARNINDYERQIFAEGTDLFEAQWIAESDAEFSGLGPHYVTDSCSSCHAGDGRAAGPTGDGPLPSGFIVLLADTDPETRRLFGDQLTERAHGAVAEGHVIVSYTELVGTFADGEEYSLRSPDYTAVLADGALPDGALPAGALPAGALPDSVVLRPRVAPHLSGLGLLELIPAADLIANADPEDRDGDGISGRTGEAVELLSGTEVLGRFGWNATQPSVEQQTATALFGDLGLTSRYFPDEACDRGGLCERRGLPVSAYYEPAGFGGGLKGSDGYEFDGEVSDEALFKLSFYARALAVPAVRDIDDPEVQRGWELFNTIGCSACHTSSFRTGVGAVQGLSLQQISPYSDLLLHDLGEGLSDQTVGGEPVGVEWRTPPLWGIGLFETVNGQTYLLHDGRARNFSEAILWHGGEAQHSATAFSELSAAERAALVRFLEAL